MRFRSARLVLSASLMLVALSFYFVDDNLSQRRPDVIELSYSKQYIVERVPFVSLFSGKALSYLRVTNQDSPEYIYRSPLYPTRLLKMQVSEVEGRVSIPNVEFLISEKKFIFHSQRWEEYWMNRFVSNTSYAVEPLSESGE
ncbi:hypothetical protein [Pseudomonas syringae]|uniref:hypothetical protein n=1 Tax=Pseudomonas syringae TaxID=317 RepID=UPI0013733170|nr:hypothetical protein [Pseudomonas syringae]